MVVAIEVQGVAIVVEINRRKSSLLIKSKSPSFQYSY